jgi:hypothetical protein
MKNPLSVSREGADQNGANPFARSESRLGHCPGEGIELALNVSPYSVMVNRICDLTA